MAKSNGRETYRKIITSPELTAQINKDNIKLHIFFNFIIFFSLEKKAPKCF